MDMKRSVFSLSLIVTMLLTACSNTPVEPQVTEEQVQIPAQDSGEVLYLNILVAPASTPVL